jgi:hypothetical protein
MRTRAQGEKHMDFVAESPAGILMRTNRDAENRLLSPEVLNMMADAGYPWSKSSLDKGALRRTGPAYVLFGGRRVYRAGDVAEWLAQRLRPAGSRHGRGAARGSRTAGAAQMHAAAS